MSGCRLHSALITGGDQPLILGPSGSWSYAAIRAEAEHRALFLSEHPATRLALFAPDGPELVITVLAAAFAGKSLAVFSRDYQAAQIDALLLQLDIDLLLVDSFLEIEGTCQQLPLAQVLSHSDQGGPCTPVGDSEILILTTGTTGTPKCARYLWSDLLDQVSLHEPEADERWLLAYKLNHFAGVQMLAHVLANQSTLVMPESTRVADAVSAMSQYAVTHVSSTPTFWRFALTLLTDTAEVPPLRQVTLGSEAVSGDLLDDLAALFPAARIVHIYALTEAGSCVSVSDGLPGLPADILDRPVDARVRFRIVDDELQVNTGHGMCEYVNSDTQSPRDAEGWYATGDLVTLADGRIQFMGRRSETINVGGVKVHPLEVERLVLGVAGVQLVRVYGRENPIVGQIVAVEIVLQPDFDASSVEDAVREACLSLPRHSRPRSLEIVDTIATSNLKLLRRGESQE